MEEELGRHYLVVNSNDPNPFEHANLFEILEQLEACDYRCEAGPLRLNLAFQELKRRAVPRAEQVRRV